MSRVTHSVAMASARRSRTRIYDVLSALPPEHPGMPLYEPYHFGRSYPELDPPSNIGPRGSATYQAWMAGRDAVRAPGKDKARSVQ